jgi:UDP-N-acetylmuramyl pentapeptide phosphotransferase/UDP-N-acetylglucosamine-1-phosphate transferase
MMNESNMAAIALTAASVSFLCCMLILVSQRWHGALSMDSDMAGAQKFHKRPVPRVGGIALLIGIVAVVTFLFLDADSRSKREFASMVALLLLASMPAFLAGLVEDLSKRVPIAFRLLATFASPLLASALLGATLPRLDIWGVDALMPFMPVALIVTAFAVAGVTNSINIIDGFNGLAGFAGTVILSALGFVAWGAGDTLLTHLAMIGIGTIFGFLLVNFPAGRLFMGDSGAYLLGFWIAEIAVLLIVRNPDVNAWQVLAICAYPVIEVLYSIYRKKFVRKMSPGVPDRLHFHMLVYRRLVCLLLPASRTLPWLRNAATSVVLLSFIAPFALTAALWGGTVPGALALILVQIFSYLAIYARLVRGHWCLNPAVGFGFRPEHPPRSMT